MELNQDEIDVLTAMETCIFHKEIVAQHFGQLPPVIPMNPEREAVLHALLHHNAVLEHLPGMLAHIGCNLSAPNVFETLDYVSGYFYKGDHSARKVRILDPGMLIQYGEFCQAHEKQVDVHKVWHVFVCRHFQHVSVQQAIMQQLAARHQALLGVQAQQRIMQDKLFGAEMFARNFAPQFINEAGVIGGFTATGNSL